MLSRFKQLGSLQAQKMKIRKTNIRFVLFNQRIRGHHKLLEIIQIITISYAFVYMWVRHSPSNRTTTKLKKNTYTGILLK